MSPSSASEELLKVGMFGLLLCFRAGLNPVTAYCEAKQREQNWLSIGGAGRLVGRRPWGGGVGVTCSESRMRFAGVLDGGSRRVEATGVLDCGTSSVIGGEGCAV